MTSWAALTGGVTAIASTVQVELWPVRDQWLQIRSQGRPGAPTSAQFASKVQPPTATQEASLVAELTRVVPALDARDAVRNTETTCRFILEDRSENAQVKITKIHFAGRDVAAMSDEDAKRIVETNGFCISAS